MSKSPIAWLEDVAEHDYDAAHNYLSLKVTGQVPFPGDVPVRG
jgi:hypothetical protein